MVKKILVIEDQYFILESIKRFLTNEGYNVITAQNGYDGLNILKESKPDLIIVDLNMPVMDGFKTISEIKKDKNFSNIPIIVLTAFSELDYIIKVSKMGVTNYVVKPFNPKDLLFRIKSALNEIEPEEEKIKKLEEGKLIKITKKPVIGNYVFIKSISINEAKPGMILGSDIRPTPDSQIIILPAGTVLTENIIEKIKKINIKTIYIQIQEGGEKNVQ